MLTSIYKEMELQKEYLSGESIQTIYFGGGTPSILDVEDIELLLNGLHKTFKIIDGAEITLEANPDDLHDKKLPKLKKAGINRLSIGIQSFNDQHLRYLNRVHSSTDAKSTYLLAREAGFENISIDLIYGIPHVDHSVWINDLHIATSLKPEHISSYCLTIEDKTAFGSWLKKGKIKEVEEEFAATQFEVLLTTLDFHGYEQYEISNFCIPGFRSKHNSNYWQQEKYLGLGPGAHSFDGQNRHYNILNNAKYIQKLKDGTFPGIKESLNAENTINEYILTSLRTSEGCNLHRLKDKGHDLQNKYQSYIQDLLDQQYCIIENNFLILTTKGKLLADKIATELFV